jgi:hypothetical protein
MTDDAPTINVITPQFEREDGKEPAPAPKTREDWAALRDASRETWAEMGMRRWSEESGLWLFPGEWFDHIPAGFEVVDIHENRVVFDPDEMSRDQRFGVLAYGLRAESGGESA